MKKRDFLKRGLLAGFFSQVPFQAWANVSEKLKTAPEQDSSTGSFSWKAATRIIRPFPAIGTIFHADFLTSKLPDNWEIVGGFTPTAKGLQSPVKGGWDVYTYWHKLVTLDEDMVSCKVAVADEQSTFAIARLSNQKKGTVAEVDFSARKLKLYSELVAPGLTPVTVVAQTGIQFPAVAGRIYKLTLQKISEHYRVTFYDTVTQEIAEINYLDTGKTPSSGKGWNFPGLIFRAGNIRLLDYTFSSGLPKSPKVLIIGDSIADGDTIRVHPNGGYQNRWAGLLAEALAYNVTIIARGGETSGQVNDKLPWLTSMLGNPAYVIYAIGTNDSSFETWQTNYLKFKAVFAAKGAEVIPATLFPRIGRELFCAAVNQYIKKSGSRFLDFNQALTSNGDGITRNEALLLPDKLHPLPAGHLKMFNQLKMDLPDLFS